MENEIEFKNLSHWLQIGIIGGVFSFIVMICLLCYIFIYNFM